MARLKGLLVWSADQEPAVLRELAADDAELVLAPLGTDGEIPPRLPAFDRVVVLADWACLSAGPTLVERWRRALGPAAVAVIVSVERERLGEATAALAAQPVDDFLEAPGHPAHLHRK